jgi:hypothetical protein
MFLLRAAFWLSVVILLLPADPQNGAQAPRVTAVEALVAARAAIADMSAFCQRNPDVCETGSAAFQVFAAKVQYSAQAIYEYFSRPEAGTGETEQTDERLGTLNPEDRDPEWRAPGKDLSA